MGQQATQVTATVVQDPVTAFIGSMQRFWYSQDEYGFLIGMAIGISCLLLFLIYKILKKS
ncbi:hypothetical protein HY621_00230 [Candidatus Uhrbacteria bacterium]|nr:hypothetical protein [Candidatus Uhrbacteria bacterium]